MSENAEPEKLTYEAKVLLVDSLGLPFLSWLLNFDNESIEMWLDDRSGLSQSQGEAVRFLWRNISSFSAENSWERQWRVSSLISGHVEQYGSTVGNVIQAIASGIERTFGPGSESIEDILSYLSQCLYPVYLLPSAQNINFVDSNSSLYNNPLLANFQAMVMEDPILRRLFYEVNQHLGPSGNFLNSTGRGSAVQLWSFAEILIQKGWVAARITNPRIPNQEEHARATLDQLQLVRATLVEGSVNAPCRVGLAGIRLPSGCELNLGWANLRSADTRDEILIPEGMHHKLTSANQENEKPLTIDYAGDVVAEISINYKIKKYNPESHFNWPTEILHEARKVGSAVQSISLAVLLATADDTGSPLNLMPAWEYFHDPLNYGPTMSQRDLRTSGKLTPYEVSEKCLRAIERYALAIHSERNKFIEVAISRCLRAVAERNDPSDVLVDCVIAWENIFGTSQGELTLRISGAIAWLLSEDADSRAKLRAQVAKMYETRSKIVHGSSSLKDEEVENCAQQAVILTIDVIRKIFIERVDLLRDCTQGAERSERLIMGR